MESSWRKRFTQPDAPRQNAGRLWDLPFSQAGKLARAPAVNTSGQHAPRQQVFVVGDFVPNDGAGMIPSAHRVHEIQAEPAADKFNR